MNLQDIVFIISAELSKLSYKENEGRTNELHMILQDRGVSFKDVVGSYKGVEETSFVVVGEENRGLVMELMRHYGQESVLVSYSDRSSYLIDRDGVETKLGRLNSVSETVAKGLDAWTYCPVLNQYYAVEA